jgi:hypothetical protein
MRALDAASVMYASTHSKSSSVGRVADSNGPSSSLLQLAAVAKSGANEAAGDVRRSTGRRLYTGARSVVPPPPMYEKDVGGHENKERDNAREMGDTVNATRGKEKGRARVPYRLRYHQDCPKQHSTPYSSESP